MPDPVLLVLDTAPSPRLGRLTGRVDVRHADASSLAGLLPAADVLLVWDAASDAVRAAWPGPGRRPGWVHTAGVRVDRVLCPELAASDTVLTNARGVFERPVAEYVAGLVLAFAKDLPGAPELRGRARHREVQQVAGARAVVVGAGPVGREITRLLHGLGVRVALVGRTARRTIHGAADLDRLAARADWVIAAVPLTDATRGMFDRRFFGLLQPSARFISVGPVACVVRSGLQDALERRWFAGAALDVSEGEPPGPDGPSRDVPGLLLSPYPSGATVGWRDRLGEQFVALYEQWARGEPLPNVVDKERGYVPSADLPGGAGPAPGTGPRVNGSAAPPG
ncbi:NAD(P)-dependent oxidoreductase [Streptomyces griseus]|uniref:NAD(P)-dependent oxidoreductase n=1 Tax=Streptomyces TaxID=1883 RepID=UPI00080589C6|nr:NAD(P)-dependent oxidoreductase [Streptomyces sp. MnatMP-M77]MYT76418.1 D-2-hydroxyacid dehydrogenase [Streptomyces sp. SID8364]SBV08563.1 Phosphoglycerate dehydrogenase [Streptomyces sp. MnatMP-M77]